MVSISLDPEVYLDCMEVVIEGCFSLGETTAPAYWEILKVLINGAKSELPSLKETSSGNGNL